MSEEGTVQVAEMLQHIPPMNILKGNICPAAVPSLCSTEEEREILNSPEDMTRDSKLIVIHEFVH